jgi:hypothetical protein
LAPRLAWWALALVAAAAAAQAEGIPVETRIEGLEARLEGLTRRLDALETLLKGSQHRAPAAAPKGEPDWSFDDYTRERPFRVLQRSLDRASGRIELLLDLTAPLPDGPAWAEVRRGEPLPLVLTVRLADGRELPPLPLHLERASPLVPGGRLHAGASLEPSLAAQASGIRVARRPPEGPSDAGAPDSASRSARPPRGALPPSPERGLP